MPHPNEGLIQAFLDGELAPPEEQALRTHLDECPACQAGVRVHREAVQTLARALSIFDREPDLSEAHARVGARLQATARRRVSGAAGMGRVNLGLRRGAADRAGSPAHHPEEEEPGHRRLAGLPLSRAASVALLLTAGAVSALPGSPVRRWMLGSWQALTGSGTTSVEAPDVRQDADQAPPDAAEQARGEAGASIAAGTGALEIWVHDLPAGATIRVQWVEGEEAGVYAGEGTRFRRGEARLEAFAPPGPVRVELPRTVSHALVGADGGVLLRVSDGQVDISGPVEGRTSSEIVFRPGS